MRIALHIFRKDTRRLWWEIVVTLGLLAALAHLDCHRADILPGPMEGIFNLLLPLAWAYLVALVIQEEPLVGDTQFWVTRPYPWPALLAAKALFVIAFIHVPSLLADAVILSVHEFPPWHCWFQLGSKQALFVLALTLPAAALAAVTRNVAQFLLAAVAISGAAVLVATSREIYWRPWIQVFDVRRGIVLCVLAGAGVAIVFLQYARRRTTWSRMVGTGAILAAGATFALLSREFTSELQCAWMGSGTDSGKLSIQISSGKYPRQGGRYRTGSELVQIPIAVSGMPGADIVWWEQLEFAMADAHGGRWRMPRASEIARPEKRAVFAGIAIGAGNAGWLMLTLDPSVYDRTKDDRVAVYGKAAARFARKGDLVRFPVGGGPVTVPGAGHCWAAPAYGPGGEMLKVVCESPSELPELTRVRLVQSGGGRGWNHYLGDSMPYISYPAQTWLSPLNRRQTFFHTTDQPRLDEGSLWLVPRDAVGNATVEITAERIAGCVVVNYQLRDLALRDYLVK